eukprot:302654_1
MASKTITAHYTSLDMEGYRGSVVSKVQNSLLADFGKYHKNKLRHALKMYRTQKELITLLKSHDISIVEIKLALKSIPAYKHNEKVVLDWIMTHKDTQTYDSNADDDINNDLAPTTDENKADKTSISAVDHKINEITVVNERSQSIDNVEQIILNKQNLMKELAADGFDHTEIVSALQRIPVPNQTVTVVAQWINASKSMPPESIIPRNPRIKTSVNIISGNVQTNTEQSTLIPEIPITARKIINITYDDEDQALTARQTAGIAAFIEEEEEKEYDDTVNQNDLPDPPIQHDIEHYNEQLNNDDEINKNDIPNSPLPPENGLKND